MSYPSVLAELERLKQLKKNTKERGKKKRIKAKIKALAKEKEQYELVYYGKVLD